MPHEPTPASHRVATFRDSILATVRREPGARLVFQPRLETWIAVNRKRGTLPARYRNIPPLGIYADLNCSFRPYHFFNHCLTHTFTDRVCEKIGTREADGVTRIVNNWSTPRGNLELVRTRTSDSVHIERFPVRTPGDMRTFAYLLEAENFGWDEGLFGSLNAYVAGDATAPALYLPRVNIMRLAIQWMGFEATHYALHDYPKETRRLIRIMDACEKKFLDVAAACPVELINYGDNVDGNLVSPPLVEEFILPAYERRADALKPAGKFLYAHWDGSVKQLLPYARTCFLDGLEALTPVPQGDVTLEEIKAAVGDMVLVDVLPMLAFMPNVPMNEFERVVRRTIDMFAPRLILGISDELAPNCDIERVRRVAQIVNDLYGSRVSDGEAGTMPSD